jgi:hypothetical protein
MSRSRSLALGLSLAAVGLAAGCGGSRSSEPTPPTTTTTATQPATTAATTTPAPQQTTFRIYLLHDGQVAPVRRTTQPTQAVARASLEQLIAGPTDTERARQLTTDVPQETQLNGISIADGVATVDLSHAFVAGAEASISLRLAQVVYTLTQFPTVTRVRFEEDGQPLPVTDGVGQPLERPAGRADYEALTPPLLVESPLPDDTVTSPLRISGSANAFEATFQAKVVDAGGKELVKQTVTATSGSGTRGTFEASLAFDAQPGDGKLVVWEDSAENGQPIHVEEIPLHFAG